MEKVTKNARIADLESKLIVMQTQINSLIECSHSHTKRLIALEPDNPFHGKFFEREQPKLKQLDQSVFDGLDEKWRFAAVDADGKAHVCNLHVKPHHEKGEFWRGCTFPPLELELIGEGYDTNDWQNSLIERKELTGSELCKAMLARGDKFILCGVSDSDDSDAENHEDDDFLAEAVTDFDDKDGLFGTTSMRWNHAVPINNQGEPLTATDVGL